MTTYNAQIVDANGDAPAFGDHATVTRTATGLTAAQVISKAWITVKASPTDADADAALQISTDDAGGSITADGAGETEGEVEFVISGDHYNELEADTNYHYDIQVLLDDGVVSTLEAGKVRWNRDITRASS